MTMGDHDFVLASLAHDRIDAALAEAARARLAREARSGREEPAAAGPPADPVLTPATPGTR
jgi:hypothetical protein